MADLIDVQNALVALAAQVMYPNGTSQPSAAGMPVKIYAGWPQANQLDADLVAGTCHLTVFPTQIERNTTRYSKDWQPLDVHPATLTLTVSGQTITVGGAIPAPFYPQNVAATVNNLSFAYATQSTDTLTSIATALAALIAVGVPGTTSNGAVITLPTGAKISAARVGSTGTSIRELRRQERVFMLSAWCNTPDHRDAVCRALDAALADTLRLIMPDQMAARIIYRNSPVWDANQKTLLYRRDMNYSVEFATTQTRTDSQITDIQVNVANQPDGATAPISNITINL